MNKELNNDKDFVESIIDRIAQFGDGPLEFETRDITRLCILARRDIKTQEQLLCDACKQPQQDGLDHCQCYEGTEWITNS